MRYSCNDLFSYVPRLVRGIQKVSETISPIIFRYLLQHYGSRGQAAGRRKCEVKPRRNREYFEITTNYLNVLIFILFLSGCAKQEHHYIPQSKQLGFIEKTESFVFDQMDQHKIDEFKLFLEEYINVPFLRVKLYYPSKTPVAFRQKMQYLLLKNGLKPKKIDFYKDIYLRDFLKVDIINYTAILPICPDWSSPIPSSKENEKLSNLGCTQQTNLGLMLEDPYDLKESSSLTPGIASEKIDAFNDKNT
ncbi:MAG: CpaD family pilus assembly lipoprotein [Alphaproteobacteria bacterium]|nr:CpaD family pilus assembly lipoprotein [Alphaproteobacteria bacterium]